jgi:integrase
MAGDIDKKAGIIHVSHNYIDSEGVKLPKNGLARDVPLIDEVWKELELCKAIPHPASRFILFNEAGKDRPIDKTTITIGFKRMLRTIGIPEAEQKKRNLLYHGLRHHYVSRGLARGLSAFEIQKFAGHQSDEMMERYAKHSEVIDFKAAREKLEKKDKAKGRAKAAGAN